MISRIRLFLGGSAAVVTLTAAVVSICADMARGLALHWVVRVICIQGNTGFRALPSGSIVDLNRLCVRGPGWMVSSL